MRWLDLIILMLATWRVASIISNEEGPYNIFGRLRQYLGEFAYVDGARSATTPWGKGIVCLWCCSVWIGILWSALYYLQPDSLYIALPFAISSGAIIADSIIERLT